MPGKNEIVAGIRLEGEKEFKQEITSVNKSIAASRSELKKTEAAYEGQANSLKALTEKDKALNKILEEQKKKVELTKQALKNAETGYASKAENVEKLRQALEKQQQKQEQANQAYEQAKQKLEKMSQEEKTSKDAIEKQEEAVNKLKTELDQQNTALETAKRDLEKGEDAYRKIGNKVSDWQTKLNTAETQLEKANRATKKNATYLNEASKSADGCATSIDKFGKSVEKSSTFKDMISANLLGDALEGGIRLIGDAAKEAGKYIVEVGSEFEAGMSEVAAISGATGQELDSMSAKAKELGASTKFSATEVASAFKYMSLAGWSTQQQLDGIDGVLNLAAASGMGLANASDMVTDYLSAFGMQASESAKMADMLAFAQANSNTTAQQLGDAYGNCAAILHTGGQDIETVTSLLEGMANQGLKGSEAGTALGSIMTQITQKMKDGAIQIGDTSVQVADSTGKFRDLTDIITDIDGALGGMESADRSAALSATFNKTALSGLNLVLNEGIGKISGYEEALRSSDGAAKNMADTMQDNLKGKLTELSSATEGLGIAAYSAFSGVMQGTVEVATAAVSGLTRIISPAEQQIDTYYQAVMKGAEQAKQSMTEISEGWSASTENADRIAVLGERLQELNSIEDKTNVQKQEMSAIVSELSQSIPELANAYDEENGKLNITNAELESLINNYEKTAIKQAALAATQDLVNQKLEAQVQIDKAKAGKDSTEERLKLLEQERDLINEIMVAQQNGDTTRDYQTEAIKLYEQALEDGIITMDEFADAQEKISNSKMGNRLSAINGEFYAGGDAAGIMSASISELSAKSEDYSNAIKEQSKITKDCDEQIQDYTDTAEKMYGVTTDDTDATKENTDATKDNTDAQAENTEQTEEQAQALADAAQAAFESAQQQRDAAQTVVDAYTSAKETIKSSFEDKISISDMFDQSEDGGVDLTVETMTANLQSQVDAMQRYQENLQTVVDAIGDKVSPEFIKYIEDMGLEGSNTLEHMVTTLETQGTGPIEEMAKTWEEAMNMSDAIASAGAANEIAMKQAAGKLGSTAEEWGSVWSAIEIANNTGISSWSANYSENLQNQVEEVIRIARECGIKIPDGLAEGIASGDISPDEMIAKLSTNIQGQMEGLIEVASQSGIKIPEEITKGIESGGNDAVTAYNSLIQLISKKAPELYNAMSDSNSAGAVAENFAQTGQQAGEAIASGIQSEQDNISNAVSSAMSGSDASADSGAFESLGRNIGDAIANGISGKKDEIRQAITSAMSADGVQTGSGFETLGNQISSGIASGITAQQTAISTAITNVTQKAIDTANKAKSSFGTAGSQSATMYASGILSGTGSASAAATRIASGAYSGASAYNGAFGSIGYNMAAGVAAGITTGSSLAVNAAVNLASRTLAATRSTLKINSPSKVFRDKVGTSIGEGMAVGIRNSQQGAVDAAVELARATLTASQDELDIHSPSRKFRKAVGQQIAKGMAFGIKDKASLASKQASRMSAKVYANATRWMTKYKKSNKVTLSDTVYFWQQVVKHTKKGTKAYANAVKQETKAVQKQLASSIGNTTLANKISNNFGVSKTKKDGKKTVKKSASEYYSEVYSAAEKYLKNYQTLHNMSTQQEISYWEGVKNRLKKGTQAWYDATGKINDLKAQLVQEQKEAKQTQANVQDSILDKYKTYYKVSAKAEMEYWNKARQQFAAGTDERISADKKYLDALQSFYDERKKIDEDYAENSKKINDELEENVKELQDTYKDAVKSRKEDILSQMNLFEAWDSSGYDADTLLYNLKTQVAGLTLWEQQLEELEKKNISKDLLDELKEMGPDAAASIYSLNQMTEEQLKEYEKLWDQKNELAESQAVKENEGLRTDTNEQIKNLRLNAQAELDALNAEYRAALSDLNTGMTSDLAGLLDKAGKIGEDAVSGLIGGIRKASDSVDVYNSTTKVVSSISSGLGELKQEGNIIGKETLDSMLEGMLDPIKIENASKTVFESVRQTILKNTQDELQGQQEKLELQLQSLNFAGTTIINEALAGYSSGDTIVNVDISSVSNVIGELGDRILDMMSVIAELKVVLDSGELVGALQPEISRQTAAMSVRINRGRL